MARINWILVTLVMCTIFSCYHKEIHYSFDVSHGGVSVGSSYYYLALIREYQLPKGISRFPDGGMSRELRQLFGLYKTDSIDRKTMLVAQLDDVYGWPVRYSTRLEKNNSIIAIGIKNINFPDSVDGIYLLDIKSGSLVKHVKQKALPTISPAKNEVAYCVGNKLCIDDFESKTLLRSYLLNSEPVFIIWKTEGEILIYFSNPFHVKVLTLSDGKIRPSELEYTSNFGQELNATQINKLLRESKPDPKRLLDSKK